MKKILVVDDDKDILAVVQLILEEKGYQVNSIWNGEKAIQSVRDFSPDVVLLDIYLGTTNGIDICNQIKQDPETKNTCIIMFSAHGKREEVLQQCPADNFISKPFDIYKLTESIAAEMDKCNLKIAKE